VVEITGGLLLMMLITGVGRGRGRILRTTGVLVWLRAMGGSTGLGEV
jgi:hypothetical protein